MNTIRFIFLLWLLVGVLPAAAQTEDLIFWEEGKRLTWQDFAGGVPAEGFAAQSALSIHYTVCKRSIWNGKVVMMVACTFQKSQSPVLKSEMHPLVLRREQAHFDIAEMFARKLRKEFSESKLHTGNVELEAKRLYEKLMLEYKVYQQLFDIEAQHGKEREALLEKWERKIANELKALEHYKDNNC